MHKISVTYYRVLCVDFSEIYIYEGFILIGVKTSSLSREFDARPDNAD